MKLAKYCCWLLLLFSVFASIARAESPPQITITSPTNGDTVAGSVTVTGIAIDDVGLQSIEIRADSGLWVSTETSESWNYTWSTYAFSGFIEGLDNHEIQQITGKTQSAIRITQMRALSTLRNKLKTEC